MLELMPNPNCTATIAAGGNVMEPSRVFANRESRPEKDSITDTLTASIVHDLRNPLAAICGCAELLLDRRLTHAQTRRVTINMHQAAIRMRDLLSQFAHSIQRSAQSPERCNLRAVLAASCEAAGVAGHSSVEIHLDVPERIEVVVVRTRIESVLVNLIVNALEAMRYGGTIRISATEARDRVLIAVEDDGPGIPAEIRTRLFEPFVTAGKKDGLGLGLMLARQTVRDHGGELWTEPAAGARFVIALPRQRPATSRTNAV